MKDWSKLNYRKLYENPSAGFQRLPFLVRAVASELLRHCDASGHICHICNSVTNVTLTPQIVTDVTFVTRAHPGEEGTIAKALETLLTDQSSDIDPETGEPRSYLVFRDGFLTIRNFRAAQRRTSAERMKDKRTKVTCYESDESDNCDESRHLVSSRLSSSESPEGVQGGIDSDRETKCPLTFEPSPEAATELQAHYGLSALALKAISDEFVSYWTMGAGAGKARSHWQAKFREHLRLMPPLKLESFKEANPVEEQNTPVPRRKGATYVPPPDAIPMPPEIAERLSKLSRGSGGDSL